MDPDNPDTPASPGQMTFKRSSSPIPIKSESQDDDGLFQNTEPGEVISLLSDYEADTSITPNVHSLGSPFHEPPSKTVQAATSPNLGSSVLSKPKATSAAPSAPDDAHKLYRAKLLGKMQKGAQETARQFRNDSQQVKLTRTPAQTASDNIFVTDSRPGTPDPAEVFSALQQDVAKKRRRGTLSLEEDIQYQRAEDAELARISKLHSNSACGESDSDSSPLSVPEDRDEEEDDMRENLDFARFFSASNDESSDDQAGSKQRGLKRKVPTSTQPPKKRGKAAKVDKTEEILAKARHKAEIKSKSKGNGKTPASKTASASKKGRNAGPPQPNLLNTANSNVFDDAAQNRDLPNQPSFDPGFTRKDTALKTLIASVPEEYRPIAKADKKYLEDATKDFTGRGVVKPADDGNWRIRGMKVTLKHYQVLGVAFMRKRENAKQAPRGGILGDEMGLGKTIMMLCNIVNGKPLHATKCHTTLIVASAALVSQWRQEIADKVHTDREKKYGIGRVKEYHASAQIKSNQELEELQECDIVLTTYTQVQKSYPKSEIPAKYTTAQQKAEWWKNHYEKERGALHRIEWHRVVLDEAHVIKNHKSLTSVACRALDAKHHWAMSGTIILNRVDEFYSTFKFLREPHTGTLKLFRNNFCSFNDPSGLEKLDVFLRKFMIRRTHLDTFFNARLLDLPQPKQTILWLDFNEIERNVYEIVKARFITRINSFSKSGDLDKQYGHMWTMILRLRQLTAHVLLVQGTIMDLLEREDFERLWTISFDDLSDESRALLIHLREKLKVNPHATSLDAREGATIVTETETVPNHALGFEEGEQPVGESHGLTYKFGRYLKSLMDSDSFEAIASRTLCCGCRQSPDNPHVTSCFHIYCYSCLKDLQDSFARRAMERHRCNECGQFYTDARPCKGLVDQFKPVYENIDSDRPSPALTANAKANSKKSKIQSWLQMNGEVLPSAKTLAVKAQILEWIEEDPDVKIICYSQFIDMLHILGRICKTEKWEFEKYTGSMSHDARDKAIKTFGDPKKNVRILLASLKCGGLGLNLTMANRVITLDPWWNRAVEQQAFCRVFRIGQTKETAMTKVCVKNTIDAAISALQDDKQDSIDAVLDDSKRKEMLSVGDLMRLFGRVVENEDGKPFIFAHDNRDDDDEHNEDDSLRRSPPPFARGRLCEDEGDEGIVDDA